MMNQVENGEETDKECPVCGCETLNNEFAQVVSGQVDGPRQTVELIVCGGCGHVVNIREVEQ